MRVFKALLLIPLLLAFAAYGQENKIRFGSRAAYIFVKDMDGFSVGAVASIPFSRFINLNPELNLIRRTLHIPSSISCGNYQGYCVFIRKDDLTEFVLGIPIQIQGVIPLGAIALSIESGLQWDIPLTKGTFQLEDNSPNKYTEDRSAYDFGIQYGLGLIIGKHFTFGFRFFVGFTSIGEKVKRSLAQGECSLGYLF